MNERSELDFLIWAAGKFWVETDEEVLESLDPRVLKWGERERT